MSWLRRKPLHDAANVVADAVYAAKKAEAKRIKRELEETRRRTAEARDQLVNAINKAAELEAALARDLEEGWRGHG